MTRHTSEPITKDVLLRDVIESDLPIFFGKQLDPDANYMAAFTFRDPTDRDAFMAHWARILGDETITIKTILFNGHVAGFVASYTDEEFGNLEVTYWIGKQYWGLGVATRALSTFVDHIAVRPLYGRVAKDNLASLRVLEKCGFVKYGEGKGFAYARGKEVEECILRLEARRVRFKSRGRGLSSIENKRNDTGLHFVLQQPAEGNQGSLIWKADQLAALIDWHDPVVTYGLAHRIKYIRLVQRKVWPCVCCRYVRWRVKIQSAPRTCSLSL